MLNLWAQKKGLSDGVNFVGPVDPDELIDIYEQVDLMVHPSMEESFGMVLVEAMARKIPVIGGEKSGAVPWVLDNGKAGVLTDIRSPE